MIGNLVLVVKLKKMKGSKMLGKFLCSKGWHKYQERFYPHPDKPLVMCRLKVCLRCSTTDYFMCDVIFDSQIQIEGYCKKNGIPIVRGKEWLQLY